jgi:hypothetical protein
MNENAYEAVKAYLDALLAGKPPAWEQLPDINLYMDQVVSYLERQLGGLFAIEDERAITPSMINNYVKAKIVPRAESKKYNQEHIALLLSVFTLKRALSVQDLAALLNGKPEAGSYREFYELFRKALIECEASTAEEIIAGLGIEKGERAQHGEAGENMNSANISESKIRELALKLAVEASLRSLAAERLLAIAQRRGPSKAQSQPNTRESSAAQAPSGKGETKNG